MIKLLKSNVVTESLMERKTHSQHKTLYHTHKNLEESLQTQTVYIEFLKFTELPKHQGIS